MGMVEKSIVNPPNEHIKDGNYRGSAPLGKSASPVNPPNAGIKDGDPDNGFLPLTHGASPMNPPNDSVLRFDVSKAKMPQPPSVEQPGKGAVPVNPFMKGGGIAPAASLPDSAMRRGK
jgi:hypothetical protein